MKKLVLVIAFFFALTVNVNAQSNEKTRYSDAVEVKINNSILSFVSIIDITPQMREDFYNIFGEKFTLISNASVTDVEKINIIKNTDVKLRKILNPEIINQLERKSIYTNMLNSL